MEYSEIYNPVSQDEALTAACPKCGAAKGAACVYVADNFTYEPPGGGYYPRVKQLLHRKGDPTGRVHSQRSAVIRDRRYAQWKEEQRDRRPVVPATENAREASAAMRAWDLVEHLRLRAWLAEFGDILVNAASTRPDGTLRGRSYADIQAEREIDGAFE